ncbi:MAG: aminotransferase class V-fold PLP-dependent enzyme, partial [Candidatus Limnocylindrales bacterium]
MDDRSALLHETADLAAAFLDSLPDRPVRGPATHAELLASMGGPLPERGTPPAEVVARLARDVEPGIVASAGPRYFGFVIGGGTPASLAADWLASAWDQNGFSYVMGPAASVAEQVAAGWILELLRLPEGASVGFSTGVTMATFTGLAAGRHRVLQRAGWNVEDDGLSGAPEIAVVIGAEAHASIFASLQMLGLGRNRVIRIEADAQGRMRPDALRSALVPLRERPVLVAAQAGNVNTGSFDPLPEIVAAVRELPNAWLHVDGAFGLWAAAAPARRHLVAGIADADSWSTDGHKWLNVPYDSGIVAVRDQEAHRNAMLYTAAYYVPGAGTERDGGNWVAESSRRARGIPLYAAIREQGRDGVAELVERCCRLAARMADALSESPGVTILNDVVLNQVLVRFAAPGAGGA